MEKVLSKDGTSIAFDRSGQGPAVILVTGALGVRSQALAATLAQRFSVIDYSRRAGALIDKITATGAVLVGRRTAEPAECAERWAAAAMPTLVITGGNSEQFFHTGARVLVESLPNASHRILEGQDHAVAPAALAPVLAEFFAG